MFNFIAKIVVTLCLVFLNRYQHCEARKLEFGADQTIEEGIIQREQCGGTIELDEGTLTYPGAGFQINPGELCVWTIHLQTMDGFRMDFSSFDIPATVTQCPEASLNVYGLTNLVRADNLQQYIFCNAANTGGDHYLLGNIATVIFWTNPQFHVNSSASGFSLNWEGSRFQPIQTEHSSSFSNSLSGIIGYPFEGEYPPNAGMTWLIRAGRSVSEQTNVDLDINFVDLENCTLPNKCLCDAVIIYQITITGVLEEVDRFCGERSSGHLYNVEKDFVVALYTDSVDSPENGHGFEIVWRQSSHQSTNEPTGETEGTTEETPIAPIYYTECGGVVDVRIGQLSIINYKLNEQYGNNEQCVWTLRHTNTHVLHIRKTVSNLEQGYDFIQVFSFEKSSSTEPAFTTKIGLINGLEEASMTAPVVFVVFSSDSSHTGTGFSVEIHSFQGKPYNYVYRDLFFNSVTGSGSLQPYFNNMMSTIVISPTVNTYQLYLYLQFETEETYDTVKVFKVNRNSNSLRFNAVDTLSGSGSRLYHIIDYSSYVLIFQSDGDTIGNGISFHWMDSILQISKPQLTIKSSDELLQRE